MLKNKKYLSFIDFVWEREVQQTNGILGGVIKIELKYIVLKCRI